MKDTCLSRLIKYKGPGDPTPNNDDAIERMGKKLERTKKGLVIKTHNEYGGGKIVGFIIQNKSE